MIGNITRDEDTQTRSIKPIDTSKSTSASARIESWFKLYSEFEETKKYLNKFQNYYVNNLFSFMGYQFKGKVENANILHISAQAWLLGLFGELKKEENIAKENKEISYNNLLKQFKQLIVEENTFIENMKLLTGVYGVNESALSDTRIFKLFLVNIQDTKNQIPLDEKEVTKSEFDETILRTLRVAFNYTLNEFNSIEENKKSLDMLNKYFELKATSEFEPLSFESYFNAYLNVKKIKIESLPQVEERKLSLNLETFTHFCDSSFDDLIEEIHLFNKNAGSVLFKIQNLLSVKNMRRMYIKYFDMLTNALEFGFKNLKLESVLNFFRIMVKKVQPYGEKALTLAKHKYTDTKRWLSHTVEKYEHLSEPYIKGFKMYYRVVLDKSMKLTEQPLMFVTERIYSPAKHLMIRITNKSVNLVVDSYKIGKEKTEELKEFVMEKASEVVKSAKNSVFGEDPLIKINYQDENKEYMSVSISKKLFLIDPTKASELVKSIIDKIAHFNIMNTACQAINFTQEKAKIAKVYLLTNYKRFLDLASEDENECEEGNEKQEGAYVHAKSD